MSQQRLARAAIYAALEADGAYQATINGLFDMQAPDGTELPYSVMREWDEEDASAHDADGFRQTVMFHDWSEYKGALELLQIREARNAVIHHQTLTIAGHSTAVVVMDYATIFDEWDDELARRIFHQVTRYRVRIMEVP